MQDLAGTSNGKMITLDDYTMDEEDEENTAADSAIEQTNNSGILIDTGRWRKREDDALRVSADVLS